MANTHPYPGFVQAPVLLVLIAACSRGSEEAKESRDELATLHYESDFLRLRYESARDSAKRELAGAGPEHQRLLESIVSTLDRRVKEARLQSHLTVVHRLETAGDYLEAQEHLGAMCEFLSLAARIMEERPRFLRSSTDIHDPEPRLWMSFGVAQNRLKLYLAPDSQTD